jgi:hypothetical protein
LAGAWTFLAFEQPTPADLTQVKQKSHDLRRGFEIFET